MNTANRRYVFGLGILILAVMLAGTFYLLTQKPFTSAQSDFESYRLLGERVQKDFNQYPLKEIQNDYTITDSLKDGVDIQFANKIEDGAGPDTTSQTARSGALAQVESSSEGVSEPAPNSLSLAFPEDLNEPLAISLPGGKVITVTHNVEKGYSRSLLTNEPDEVPLAETKTGQAPLERSLSEEASSGEVSPTYVKYTSSDDRINTYYAYQKDQAAGYRNLKHWTIFDSGDGHEEQSYTFTNAHITTNDKGEAEVRYLPDNFQSNEEIKSEVGQDLWERAKATLGSELNNDIENQPADFTIPAPYIIDSLGNLTTYEWQINETNDTLTVTIDTNSYNYPIALDPTLQFTAPGVSNAGDVITGEAAGDSFGGLFTTGDFNNDGKDDLVVGASGYPNSTFIGKVYVFYSGIPTSAIGADVVITGEATFNFFGTLTTGDFNNDGKDDLVVGAQGYSSSQGRVYVFYNDNLVSQNASTADIIIAGGSSYAFGSSFTTGDFNNDGKDDLVVGATSYSTNTGRVFIFYNDGSIPTTAATADVIITGQTGSYFGSSFTTGDFNNDGKDDLVVGARGYSTNTGRTYIFYNDGSIPTTAATADVIITGEASSYFGISLQTGDFNNDGKDDLVVGASIYSTNTGRVYIFYGDSSLPTTAATADVIMTGETASNLFGTSLNTGDFNNDGKDDLVVSASNYDSYQGRTYIFYSQSGQVNLNSHITGEGTGDYFGSAMTVGDFNNDGRDDLAVGAYKDATNTGKVYIFYGDGDIPTGAGSADVIITGGGTNNFFGYALTTGDFNNDGKDDLVVGAFGYSTFTGRTYIFYGDGSIPTTAATADVIITGEGTYDSFGGGFATGDFDNDGTDDLVVSATQDTSNRGKVYIIYNDGSIPTSAGSADVIITGENTNQYFGSAFTTVDLNNDGREDLVVGASFYSVGTGRVYVFYNDGSIPTTAGTADITITGSNYPYSSDFGISLTTGDFNADGKDDLVVGADDSNANIRGSIHIFYNDGSISTTSATADVIISSENQNSAFGRHLTVGDLNNDGKDDLVVAAPFYSSFTGRSYIYYGGTFSASMEAATSSSVMVTGDSANDDFGFALVAGDMNHDGKDDLIIGAPGYNNGGDTGRVYFYQTREDYAWEIQRSDSSDGLRVDLLAGYEMKITGEPTEGIFASAIAMADLNNDGKEDLIVGAPGYNSGQGGVYIFYNDGNYPTRGGGADVVLTGETSSYFGAVLTTGDLNNDGKDDLAVGAYPDSSFAGRTYIFYGDGSIPTTAATADVIITGESSSGFGYSLTTGDFNADGKDDLVVGAYRYNNYQGRAYIFYGDGSIPTTAATADVIITGETFSRFGYSLATGDFNNDGRVDLAVGAYYYSSNIGRTYIFYGDGSIPTTAATADVTITGEASSYFGTSLTTGDFNNDGKDDLAVGAFSYSSFAGRTYIFYGDGSIPTTAATADVTITGEASSRLGNSLATGDFNNDGRDDLVVGATYYSAFPGSTYIFYGDGSIPTTAAAADIILTGEGNGNQYGVTIASGDINNDGTDDILVGATGYNSSQGRLYMYTTNDRHITGEGTDSFFGSSFTSGDYNNDGKTDLAVGAYGWDDNYTGQVYLFYGGSKGTTTASGADVIITGESSSFFSSSLTTGDFNNDGKDDLVVGASAYNTSTGRVYIFYGDGSIPSSASSADISITGQTTNNLFGLALAVVDLNSDGREDLIVGAEGYSSYTGRAYIFYNDGSIPTTAATADIIITGETTSTNFGHAFSIGDFNSDGKDDLAVTASSGNGSVHIFYNDGSIPTTADTADISIVGETTSSFGSALATGDFNNDGKDDLVVGAYTYSTVDFSNAGRTYIFYNDGSIPTTAATADVVITGEDTSSYMGYALAVSDFNADSKDDLAIGAFGYLTSTGRIYVFYGGEIRTRDAVNANLIITGEKINSNTGRNIYSDDLNDNGVDDIIIGAGWYDTSGTNNEGRVYVLMSEASAEHVSTMKINGTVKFNGSVKFH